MSDDLLKRLDAAPLSPVPMGTLWLYCKDAAARIRELEARAEAAEAALAGARGRILRGDKRYTRGMT